MCGICGFFKIKMKQVLKNIVVVDESKINDVGLVDVRVPIQLGYSELNRLAINVQVTIQSGYFSTLKGDSYLWKLTHVFL